MSVALLDRPALPDAGGRVDATGLPSRPEPVGAEPADAEPVDPGPVDPRPAVLPITAAALTLLDRSRDGLRQAVDEREPGARYATAHLAALRAATAVLAVRGRPAGRRSGPPRSVWQVLPRLAPELGEWAAVFSALAPVRSLVEGGRHAPVDPRTADDLLRDAERFCQVVTGLLGLPWSPVLPDALPSCS